LEVDDDETVSHQLKIRSSYEKVRWGGTVLGQKWLDEFTRCFDRLSPIDAKTPQRFATAQRAADAD